MKIIAIDLGDSKTGLACCDLNETLAFPVCTIFETNHNILIEKILNIILKLEVNLVVIGNPINMDGSVGHRSQKCSKFAEKLKSKIKNIPITLWDERQTTILANRLLIEANTKKHKKKKIVDEVAATIILENYLKFRKNQIK